MILATSRVAGSLLLGVLAAGPLGTQAIERGGLQVGLEVRGDQLKIEAKAPTQGWMVVGFNDRKGLQGARLLFMRVRNGRAECELHRTDFAYPRPFHRPRTHIGGKNAVSEVEGQQNESETRVSCSIPMKSGEPLDIELYPGKPFHLILAWSVSDDFDHHSRFRTELEFKLEDG